jgi:uncharacterized protein YqgC (DUF456 family)
VSFALWSLAVLLILVGAIGTVVPVLPGAVIVFVGMLLAAWLDSFDRVGPWTLTLLAAITILVYVVDFAGGAFGAHRLGASRRAVWGAALGAIIGIFFGIPGIVIGPFAGAVLGEYTLQRDMKEAGKAGAGAWLGLALAAAAKIALVVAMLVLFATAYLL